jgi:hypothetical protein
VSFRTFVCWKYPHIWYWIFPTWRIGFSPMCYLMLHIEIFHSIRFCYTRCSSNIPLYLIYPLCVLWTFPILSHIYTCMHLCIRWWCVHSLFLARCALFFIISSFWTNLCKWFKINRTHTQTQKLTISCFWAVEFHTFYFSRMHYC